MSESFPPLLEQTDLCFLTCTRRLTLSHAFAVKPAKKQGDFISTNALHGNVNSPVKLEGAVSRRVEQYLMVGHEGKVEVGTAAEGQPGEGEAAADGEVSS